METDLIKEINRADQLHRLIEQKMRQNPFTEHSKSLRNRLNIVDSHLNLLHTIRRTHFIV